MSNLRAPLALLALALVLPASASLVASEGFDYGSGPLDGLNGGTGFSDSWDAQNDNGNYVAASTTPLSYGTLASSAGYATAANSGSYESTGRRFDTGAGGVFDSAGLVSDPFTAGLADTGTIYVSYLYRQDSNGDTDTILGTSNIGWFGGGGKAGVLVRGGDFNLTVDGGNNSTATGIASVVGATNLLVLKIVMSTGETSLFVNPTDLGGAEPTATLSATGSAMGFKSITMNYLNGGLRASLDEIRVGTTYADVTPVPEPASMAVLGLGLAALKRRRKNA